MDDRAREKSPATPPKQKAAALKYNTGDTAPKVVASGKGYIAEKILENAGISDVPVYRDEKLVEELTRLDLGDSIPPELYEIVAQVLIFISDLDRLEELRNVTKR